MDNNLQALSIIYSRSLTSVANVIDARTGSAGPIPTTQDDFIRTFGIIYSGSKPLSLIPLTDLVPTLVPSNPESTSASLTSSIPSATQARSPISPGLQTGAIVGITIGVLGGVAVGLLAGFLKNRWNSWRRSQHQVHELPQPTPPEITGKSNTPELEGQRSPQEAEGHEIPIESTKP